MDNKTTIDYRKYLPKIYDYATRYYGTRRCRGRLCEDAAISPQRWSELEKGIKKTSAYYLSKMMGALLLDINNIEGALNMKFSESEKKQLRYQQYVSKEEKFIMALMDRPLLMKQFKEILENTKNNEKTDSPN